MKKRNEDGYVLVYVMVVVFVLCAIALALMSSTLRTLQAQEAMVQRMTDKYEAMGEIERVVAELEYECENTLTGTNSSSEAEAKSDAEEDFIKHIKDFASASDTDAYSYKEETNPDSPSAKEHYLLFNVDYGDIQINAKLQLLLDKCTYNVTPVRNPNYDADHLWWETEGSDVGAPEPQEYTYHYSVDDVVFSFTSYQIGGDS